MLPAVSPSIIGPIIFMQRRHEAHRDRRARARRRRRAARLVAGASAARHLEQRAVGIEGVLGPGRAVDRHDRQAWPAGRRLEPGGVGDLQLGDPGQLLDLDALDRIDVGLGVRRPWRSTGRTGGRRPSSWGPAAGTSWRGRRRCGRPWNGLAADGSLPGPSGESLTPASYAGRGPFRAGERSTGSRVSLRTAVRDLAARVGRRGSEMAVDGGNGRHHGCGGPLGRRVVALTAADPAVDAVIVIDPPGESTGPSDVTVTRSTLELTDPDLQARARGRRRGRSTSARAPALDRSADGDDLLDGTGRAGRRRRRHAPPARRPPPTPASARSWCCRARWSTAPGRTTRCRSPRMRRCGPTPELRFAVEKAEIERLAGEWRDAAGDWSAAPAPRWPPWRSCARPSPSGPRARRGWGARRGRRPACRSVTPSPRRSSSTSTTSPPRSISPGASRLDGPFNVAADGWIPAEQLRALSGPAPRLPPARRRSRSRSAALRCRSGLTGTSPGGPALHAMHSWVVANDRLRAAGWEPAHSNEEAFVEADNGGRSPRLEPQAPPAGRVRRGRFRRRRRGRRPLRPPSAASAADPPTDDRAPATPDPARRL